MKFVNKIYHPNIDDDGSICVDLLKPDIWKPATKLVNGKKRYISKGKSDINDFFSVTSTCSIIGST